MSTSVKPTLVSFHMIRDELLARGYQAELLGLSRRYTRFTAPNGSIWITRNGTVGYPFIDYAVQKISADKQLSYEFAESQGVAIPKTLSVKNVDAAARRFLETYGPLVVKPLNSFGSRGLTIGVRTQQELAAAINRAQEFSDTVLAQQQVQGGEVRITVINGQVVSAMLRQTPRVTGDGVSTVAQLIEQENAQRAALDTTYIAYPQLSEANIAAHFMTDQTVPAAGEVVEFSKSTMVKTGASLYNITADMHDSYKQTASKLASRLSLNFLIVDMMVQDYTQPQTADNYAFIEFNTAPALKMYYATRDGRTCDIVTMLADMIDNWGHKND